MKGTSQVVFTCRQPLKRAVPLCSGKETVDNENLHAADPGTALRRCGGRGGVVLSVRRRQIPSGA